MASQKPPMTPEEKLRIGLLASEAFSPSQAIKEKDVFAGRSSQIRQAVQAIAMQGRSVLIYGERGVGKTSLANVIDDFYLSVKDARIFAPHIACAVSDDFASIWRKVVEEKDSARPTVGLSERGLGEIDAIMDDSGGELEPHHVRRLADIVGQTHLFIPIIDEFDRVEDDFTTRLMTDTIKQISDHSVNTTIILVGVGDTVQELIGEHESVQRAIEQVWMKRMRNDELAQILDNSKKITGLGFEEEAKEVVVALSQGLPHYTHLLGQNGVLAAVDDGEWLVQTHHVESATDKAIASSHQSLLAIYNEAVTSPRPESIHKEVLLAAAMASTDSLGYFAPADVIEPLTQILQRKVTYGTFTGHLREFSSAERGSLLQEKGEARKWRYRFRDSLIPDYPVDVRAFMNGTSRLSYV